MILIIKWLILIQLIIYRVEIGVQRFSFGRIGVQRFSFGRILLLEFNALALETVY